MQIGSLWKRLLALVFDQFALGFGALVCGLLAMGVLYFLRSRAVIPRDEPLTYFQAQLLMSTAYVILSLPYYVVGIGSFGTTFGKNLLGLRVVSAREEGRPGYLRALIRFVGYSLSWIFGLGFLVAVLDPRRRALHDWIAGTVVVDDRRLRQLSGATEEEVETNQEYWKKRALP